MNEFFCRNYNLYDRIVYDRLKQLHIIVRKCRNDMSELGIHLLHTEGWYRICETFMGLNNDL
jgi:hypothetical protein